MSTMAEVILEHRFTLKGSCACGAVMHELNPERIARHLADALTGAGYGKLATIEPEHMRIENGYLVAEVNGCTCGGGGPECNYAHENGCGLEPLTDITDALARSGYGNVREARAAELEAAAFGFMGDFITGDYNSTPQQVGDFLRERAAAIRDGDS